jgi:hypothetical protein
MSVNFSLAPLFTAKPIKKTLGVLPPRVLSNVRKIAVKIKLEDQIGDRNSVNFASHHASSTYNQDVFAVAREIREAGRAPRHGVEHH